MTATTTQTLGPAREHPCARCGRRADSWQHRVARGRGGPTDAYNCVPLCGSGTTGCHGWAEEHPTDAQVEGFDVAGSFVRSGPGCCLVYVGPNVDYHVHYNLGGHARDCGFAHA